MSTDTDRLDMVQRCAVTLGPAMDPCSTSWYAYMPGLAIVEGKDAREALDRLLEAARSIGKVDVVEDQARLDGHVE